MVKALSAAPSGCVVAKSLKLSNNLIVQALHCDSIL